MFLERTLEYLVACQLCHSFITLLQKNLCQKRWTEKQKHSQENYPVHLLSGSNGLSVLMKTLRVSSRLVTSSKSPLEIVLGTQSRKAFGDFGERSKPRRTEKGEKKIELRLGLNWPLNQRRSSSCQTTCSQSSLRKTAIFARPWRTHLAASLLTT